MNTANTEKGRYLFFGLAQGQYAVSSELVREILIMPPVVPVPRVARDIMGVINVRGKIVPVIDLRVRLGLGTATREVDELIQLLRDREQDHRNWLKELEDCVRAKREFKLARDPHKCKFGTWYDQYRNTENSIHAALFRIALSKMAAPHAVIHASAGEILGLSEKGDQPGALALLEQRRNRELAEMIRLFEDARRILKESRHELALLLKNGAREVAVSIDTVQTMENLPTESIEPLPATFSGAPMGANCEIIRKQPGASPALLLGAGCLFSSPSVN
jgi:purine-binding chemotaxis protein CheW